LGIFVAKMKVLVGTLFASGLTIPATEDLGLHVFADLPEYLRNNDEDDTPRPNSYGYHDNHGL